jgi:hypothetical protein
MKASGKAGARTKGGNCTCCVRRGLLVLATLPLQLPRST